MEIYISLSENIPIASKYVPRFSSECKEYNSKITQLNPDSNITIWLAVEIILYLLVDELKGISNEWFIRHNTLWRFWKWGYK